MPFLAALIFAQEPWTVPLSCLAPGTALRVDRHGTTRPLYAGLRLTIGEPGRDPDEVLGPDDLKDRVRIATAAQALEFVRLLRSPGLWPFFFDKPMLEIRRQPVLFPTPRPLYGDLRIYTISGWDGVLSDRDWDRLGLKEPAVTGGSGKDWSVRRPCLLMEDGKPKTGTLVERVSESGRYVWSVERKEDAPSGVRWFITTRR